MADRFLSILENALGVCEWLTECGRAEDNTIILSKAETLGRDEGVAELTAEDLLAVAQKVSLEHEKWLMEWVEVYTDAPEDKEDGFPQRAGKQPQRHRTHD